MIRRIMTVAVTIVFALFVGAVPAQAALSDCPSTKICFFPQLNGGGNRLQYDGSADGLCRAIAPGWLTSVSSMVDNAPGHAIVVIFKADGCDFAAGNCTVAYHQQVPSVSAWCGPGWDNHVRSFMFGQQGG